MYQPTRESLRRHAVPAWYHGAKLGIFIHWSVSSVPGFAPRGLVGRFARVQRPGGKLDQRLPHCHASVSNQAHGLLVDQRQDRHSAWMANDRAATVSAGARPGLHFDHSKTARLEQDLRVNWHGIESPMAARLAVIGDSFATPQRTPRNCPLPSYSSGG